MTKDCQALIACYELSKSEPQSPIRGSVRKSSKTLFLVIYASNWEKWIKSYLSWFHDKYDLWTMMRGVHHLLIVIDHLMNEEQVELTQWPSGKDSITCPIVPIYRYYRYMLLSSEVHIITTWWWRCSTINLLIQLNSGANIAQCSRRPRGHSIWAKRAKIHHFHDFGSEGVIAPEILMSPNGGSFKDWFINASQGLR